MMKQNKLDIFNFTINSIEAGWLKARIMVEDTSLDFTVSYLSEPLSSFLEVLLELDAHYDRRYYLADGLKPEFHLVWQGEPWQYTWLFEPQQDRKVAITIFYCEDHLGSKNTEEHIKIKTVVTLDNLMREVSKEAESILKTYGFLGYKTEWIQSDFPIGDLLRLHSVLNGDEPQEKSLSKEVGYFNKLLRSQEAV
ncbi:MAG: hypothetical protein JETT_1643 [Candidatus Jettenia ecosi]|uniref:Uncharacterized protein n=1 Tax=Candidatus Jettenia ecosi TaxID=2494326 RepID=A0A533QBH7_9BACT|nr:MAG: hypothetical protein JETT_1643 [Candidatus Jettenia ecosi]